MTAPQPALLTGASGFVGRRLLHSADRPLRVLAHSSPVDLEHEVVRGDLLEPGLPWTSWLDGMTRLVHAARPSAGTDRGRRRIAKRTAVANEALLSAAHTHGVPALAVHGSLSYGDRGEAMVHAGADVNPIGYAEAYAVGEAPWRAPVGPGAPSCAPRGSLVPVRGSRCSTADRLYLVLVTEACGCPSWMWTPSRRGCGRLRTRLLGALFTRLCWCGAASGTLQHEWVRHAAQPSRRGAKPERARPTENRPLPPSLPASAWTMDMVMPRKPPPVSTILTSSFSP